jgi:hypothetical protein
MRHLPVKIGTSETSWAKRSSASVRISFIVETGSFSEEYGRPWRETKTAGSKNSVRVRADGAWSRTS